MKKFHKIILLGLVVFAGSLSCTNLDEHVYHNLMSANYYQKKSDVIKAVFRPFEHFFEGVQRYVPMQELPADVFMTPQMDSYGWWDGGKWSDWHTHTWQDISGDLVGFRLPGYVQGINAPGWHLHFMDADRKRGGHVLNFSIAEGKLSFCYANDLQIRLPDSPDVFAGLDLNRDWSADLKKAEAER